MRHVMFLTVLFDYVIIGNEVRIIYFWASCLVVRDFFSHRFYTGSYLNVTNFRGHKFSRAKIFAVILFREFGKIAKNRENFKNFKNGHSRNSRKFLKLF